MTKKKQFKKKPMSCFRVFLDCFFFFKNLQQKKTKNLLYTKLLKTKNREKQKRHKKGSTKNSQQKKVL